MMQGLKSELDGLIEHRNHCRREVVNKLLTAERLEGEARERQIERALVWAKRQKSWIGKSSENTHTH
ncbi:hypothetical protein ACLB1T_02730 [Escherichia coli]